MRWVSPTVVVGRFEREAVGQDGERYAWTSFTSTRSATGGSRRSCVFELDDEEAAFTYAEERVRASASRLALTNRARETVIALASAGRARDVDAMFGWYSDGFTYDDRRRLSGDPITTAAALRAGSGANTGAVQPLRLSHAGRARRATASGLGPLVQ